MVFFLALIGLTLGACTTVEPWERANLGQHIMIPNRDPLAKGMSEHLYFSREAAFGGESVGGGGCGCN